MAKKIFSFGIFQVYFPFNVFSWTERTHAENYSFKVIISWEVEILDSPSLESIDINWPLCMNAEERMEMTLRIIGNGQMFILP